MFFSIPRKDDLLGQRARELLSPVAERFTGSAMQRMVGTH